MKVIGIDPGIGRTGWAILENSCLLKSGCLETLPNSPLPIRLKYIYTELTKILQAEKPHHAAIEDLFFENNAKTAIAVGAGRGVIVLTCALANITVFNYSPLQVKSAVTGNGHADKKSVEHMVKKLLKLEKTPKPDDIVDAIAIALTHLAIFR